MKHLKKSTIRFIEENKEIIKELIKYGNGPYSYMAQTMMLAYQKEKRRKH